MQRSGLFLLIVGVLIVVGMGLLFYGSQIIAENLVTESANVISGESLEVISELDSSITQNGIYIVQTLNFKENSIHVKIIDPFGSQVVTKTVESESFEGSFEISVSGSYTMIIENGGNEETMIVGMMGNHPDENELSFSRNVTFTGIYLLIVGMIGLVGVGIYAVINRRKNKLS